MAQDLNSSNAKEALQAFVDANDQLEGITAVSTVLTQEAMARSSGSKTRPVTTSLA